MSRGKNTLDKFFSKLDKGSKSIVESSTNSTSNDNENTINCRKRVRVETELSDNDVIGDPALRKPIDSYHVDIRDELRRRYLAKDPCQPYGHAYPTSEFSKIRRSFQENWFKKFDWLEYSVSKDAAYCLWCYLFAQSDHKHGDNAFKFVNNQGVVIERFLGVVHVSDTSAHSLNNSIHEFFAKNGLSMSRVRGQGYDGASNMRGEFNGLKALILKENEHAHYIHCFAHRLQLIVVANVSQNGYVCSFFEYLSMIVNVTGASCKRRDDLRQRQYDDLVKRIESSELHTGRGMNQEMSLARAGDTRWGSHFNTIARLFDLWNPVKEVLHTVFEDGNDLKSRGIALGLIDKMKSFEFVFIGQLMKHLLGMTNTLSQVLQHKNQNIGLAVQLIKVLKDELKEFRNDGWDKLLEEVTKFCNQHKILVPKMEDIIQGRGRKIVDGQKRTHLHHFRVDIFLQVVDVICQEIDNRFNESNSELIMCISCLDPSYSFAKFDCERIFHLAELYSQDFSMTDLSNLRPQLRTYHRYVLSEPAFNGLVILELLQRR